jgi:hypothetical protein
MKNQEKNPQGKKSPNIDEIIDFNKIYDKKRKDLSAILDSFKRDKKDIKKK